MLSSMAETELDEVDAKPIDPAQFVGSVAFFYSQSPGVQYHRIFKYAEELQKRKWLVLCEKWKKAPTMEELQESWEMRVVENDQIVLLQIQKMCEMANVSVFQRLLTDHGVAMLEALREKVVKKPLLVELDDDPFHVDADNPAWSMHKPGDRITYVNTDQIKISDAIIVSTPYLGDYLTKQFQKPSFVVPNGIRLEDWQVTHKPKTSGRLRIGWEGSRAHLDSMRLIKYVIPKILKDFPDVEFYFWGNLFPEWLQDIDQERILLDKQFVSIDQYPQGLVDRQFDIGIAPLADTFFNRAKTNIRWQEYSMAGVPSVVSRVVCYGNVEHGKTGLVAQEESEWYEALASLIRDEKLRQSLATQAKDDVLMHWTVKQGADRYEEALRNF